LDALQAAVLNVKFRFLDGWTADRQRNAERYDKALSDTSHPIKIPGTKQDLRHIYNQYVIATTDRDALQTFLGEKGVATEVYYPVPLHLQECFQHLGYRRGDCPEAERAAQQTLALPVYPELSQQQQDYVIAQISSFFSSKSSRRNSL
jgi:dTDP-4-amino-4,6-dideoxygalactose transaminase